MPYGVAPPTEPITDETVQLSGRSGLGYLVHQDTRDPKRVEIPVTLVGPGSSGKPVAELGTAIGPDSDRQLMDHLSGKAGFAVAPASPTPRRGARSPTRPPSIRATPAIGLPDGPTDATTARTVLADPIVSAVVELVAVVDVVEDPHLFERLRPCCHPAGTIRPLWTRLAGSILQERTTSVSSHTPPPTPSTR